MHLNDVFHDRIDEDLKQWDTQRWVHYSDSEMLKIASGIRDPKTGEGAGFHQDPAGIYFFPETFLTRARTWMEKKYKYVVTLKPGARILDYGAITDEQLDDLLQRTGAKEDFDDTLKRYPQTDRHRVIDIAWDCMKRVYMRSVPAAWNKAIRAAGWDAVFDDTNSIHVSEVQLLVLDPRIIASIERTTRKGRGFKEMLAIFNEVKQRCASYGTLTEQPPRLKEASYSRKKNLVAEVRVGTDANYAAFKIEIDASDRQRKDFVTVSLSYSKPYLESRNSAAFSLASQSWDDYHTLDKAMSCLSRVFPNGQAEGGNEEAAD